MIPAVLDKLKDNLKSTILIGRDLVPEKAVSLEVVKMDIGPVKGLAIDVTAGTKGSVGAGISKDVYKNDLIEVDAGLYVTKKVQDIFKQPKKMPELKIGLSAKFGGLGKKGYIKNILKNLTRR